MPIPLPDGLTLRKCRPRPRPWLPAVLAKKSGPDPGGVGGADGRGRVLENGAPAGQDHVGQELLIEGDDPRGHGLQLRPDQQEQPVPAPASRLLRGLAARPLPPRLQRITRRTGKGKDEAEPTSTGGESDGRPAVLPSTTESGRTVVGEHVLDFHTGGCAADGGTPDIISRHISGYARPVPPPGPVCRRSRDSC